MLRKIRKNIRNLRFSNARYYFELFLEDLLEFKYPPGFFCKYSVNPFKLRKIKKLLKHSKKLHIGCGNIKVEGFINIDVLKTPATDFVCRIEDLPKYIKRNSIELIYTSHVLEHFSKHSSLNILKMFYEFLIPSGELRLSVPDLKKIDHKIRKRHLDWQDMELIEGVLMGGQETRYNFHRSAYWCDYLKAILLDIGFRKACRYRNSPYFLANIFDASSIADISLNMKAKK